MSVRIATEDDLDEVVRLTIAYRQRLAAWAPVWWRKSISADQAHPGWLAHMLRSPKFSFRVVEVEGVVEGCAVSVPQKAQWFIDDVAVIDDSRWPSGGVDLLAAVSERPALTCVPTADVARLAASRLAGLDGVSSYWIGPPRDAPMLSRPLGDQPVPAPARHSFGGGLDPTADGALCLADGDGVLVGSPPFPAPPIYDPGGTVCVIDRITGSARQGLLDSALSMAFNRGDVLVSVIVAEDDPELAYIAAERGLQRTVDVFSWP
jgi:hypothetical protein